MKKISILLFCVLSLGIAQAQRNTFSFGNKSLKEAEKVIALFNEQIQSFEKKIDELSLQNDSLWPRFEEGKEEAKKARNLYARHAELILSYEEEILAIEKMKKDFIWQISLQGEKALRFKTSSPAKIRAAAEAYSVISYAEAQSAGGQATVAEVSATKLKGLAVNDHYSDVVVVIMGPGSFRRSAPLARRGGTFNFDVPYPGTYIFSFYYKGGVKRVSVDCKPGLSVFYDNDGNKYDLKATLMSSW